MTLKSIFGSSNDLCGLRDSPRNFSVEFNLDPNLMKSAALGKDGLSGFKVTGVNYISNCIF